MKHKKNLLNCIDVESIETEHFMSREQVDTKSLHKVPSKFLNRKIKYHLNILQVAPVHGVFVLL